MKNIPFFIWFIIIFIVFFGIGYAGHVLMRPPRVALLYIATGRYMVFWDGFYTSAEKNFLPGFEKHYFLFTDDVSTPLKDNVTRVYRKQHPWPHDTLDRFDLFLSIEDQLKRYDYIYFLNANAEIVGIVGEEILPSKEQGIMVAWHPGYYRQKNPMDYPYDRNPQSAAYIPMGQGTYYVQGGFNGGRRDDYLKLIHVLDQAIKKDAKNKVTAKWHDESHLNKYILDKNPLVMTPNYIWTNFDYVVLKQFKDNMKIVMRYKYDPKYGGTKWLRGMTDRRYDDQPSEEEKKSAYHVKTKDWEDYMVPDKAGKYCRYQMTRDCGTISKNGPNIIVKWDKWHPETFIWDPKKQLYILK